MPVVKEREYRNINIDQFDALDDGYRVEGYATVFDTPYEMGDGTFEVISSRAFETCDMSDVIFQYDHSGMVLARQRNKTLQVDLDSHGMHVVADLGKSERGRELHEAIRNGLVDRMSWAFMVNRENGWQWDSATRTSTVSKVDKVFDVSAVSIPACEGTVIQARSYLDGAIGAAQAQEMREREQVRRMVSVRMNLTRFR